MKSLFRGAFLGGVSARALSVVLAASLAACTANPQALNRPGDVPAAFTAPVVRGLTQLDSGVLNSYVTEAEGRVTTFA